MRKQTRARLDRHALLPLLLALLLSLAYPSAPVDSAGLPRFESSQPGLYVLESTASTMLLELIVPAPQLDTVTVDGQAYDRVYLDDTYEWTEEVGKPLLPVKNALLGIPDLSTVRAELIAVEEQLLPGTFRVYPVPEVVLNEVNEPGQRIVDPPSPQATGTEYNFTIDEDFYTQDVSYPDPVVQVTSKGYMRDQLVARLHLRPLRFNPALGQLWAADRMVVRLHFDGASLPLSFGLQGGDAPDGSDPLSPRLTSFDEALSTTLLNYEQALAWRVPRAQAQVRLDETPAAQAKALEAGQQRFRVETAQEGMHAITYADLAAAGADAGSIDPATFRLESRGVEMAVEVTGAQDGHFDPGDAVRFYATKAESLYTWHNVFWLSFGGSPAAQVSPRTVDPAGGGDTPASFEVVDRFEESAYYQSDLPRSGFEADRWYWTFTRFRSRGAILSRTVTITLGIPAAITQSVTLSPSLYGATSRFLQNPDHYSRFFVNDQLVGDGYWDGYTAFEESVTFDGSILQPGANTFTLNTPGGLPGIEDDVVFLNWLEFRYQHAYQAVDDQLAFTATGPGQKLIHLDGFSSPDLQLYDITDAAQATPLTGFQVSDMGGSYRLSFSDALSAETKRYLAFSTAHLQTPATLLPDEANDLHNPGSGADYLVIAYHSFLAPAQALANHRTTTGFQPRVIDVQDIYDDFNDGMPSPVAIRDFLAYAYLNWPEPAPAYVVLLGDGTYDFKDYLGFGAQTYIPPLLDAVDPFIGETATDNGYVTIVGNDSLPDLHLGRLPANSPGEAWTMVNKIINYEASPPEGDWRYQLLFATDNADTAGNFPYMSDEVAENLVPEPYQANKIYYGDNYTDIITTRNAIKAALNSGTLLANYVGHSSITWWAAEILLGATDVSNLQNGDRLPVMLPMTCYDGYFHSPIFSSLAETLVRASGRGAIASWSATGQGVATGHDYMHRGFYEAVFYGGVRRLGPATLAGKLKLFTDDFRFRDLIDTFGLLGDPALELNLPNADLALEMTVVPDGPAQPGDVLTYTMSYVNQAMGPVPNAVLTTAIPSALLNLTFSTSDGDVAPRPGTRYVWDLGPLAIDEGGVITITGQVPETLSDLDAPYSAGSRVLSVWQEENLTNNKGGPVYVPVLPTDLAVDLAITDPAQPGGQVQMEISYRNHGPSRASRPQVTLTPGFALSDVVITFTGPQPLPQLGSNLTWHLPMLEAGASGTIRVTGRLSSTIALDQLPLLAQAHIQTAWLDNVEANDTSPLVAVPLFLSDPYEPDDNQGMATILSAPSCSSGHTHSFPGDVDWYRFQAQEGRGYAIRTLNLSLGGDTLLSLHRADGSLVMQNDDRYPGSGWSGLDWQAPADGVYYLGVSGSWNGTPGFRYDLCVGLVRERVFLPMLMAN